MLSLRAKLLLFLLPIIIGSLVCALSMSLMVESLPHPEWWIGGIMFVFSMLMIGTVWLALDHVTASLEYAALSMEIAGFEVNKKNNLRLIKRFSDASEIRDILDAADHMKRNLERARLEVFENMKLAEIGNNTAKLIHDIASPLVILEMTTKQLKQHQQPELVKIIELFDKSSHRIRSLYNDLLEQYRGKPLKIEVFSLPNLLDSVTQTLQEIHIGKSVTWLRQDDSLLSERDIKGSQNLLYRAIANITKNALEALYQAKTPEPTLTITTLVVDNQFYEIRIHDNGPGIPENIQALLLHGGITQGKKDGHGLGMQVARQAVEFHGGQLKLCSSPDKGTTFVLKLPFDKFVNDVVVTVPELELPHFKENKHKPAVVLH